MEPIFVYVTVGTKEEAWTIARALVEERLAACANVGSGVSSVYWWGGKMEEAAEVVLFAKTRRERLDALVSRVKSLHSYSCPCVVALPIAGGNPAFLEWIERETA